MQLSVESTYRPNSASIILTDALLCKQTVQLKSDWRLLRIHIVGLMVL